MRVRDAAATARPWPAAGIAAVAARRDLPGITRALQPFQIGAQFRGALIARFAILLERLEDDVIELGRHAVLDLRRRGRLPGQQPFEDRRHRRALEGQLAGGHLIQHDAGGKDVAPRVDLLPARLLGRHVRHGPDGRAHRRQLIGGAQRVRIAAARRLTELGDAEVEHLDRAAASDEEIGRLDVAMDDALGMRGLERVGHLGAELQHFVHGERTAGDAILQRLAIEQLHHHELLADLP